MPWGRLNDKANDDDKLLALSDSAWRMWGCGLIYCQNKLTDGFIPAHAIETFGVRAKNRKKVADELCSVLVKGKGPLWHRVDGGYRIHDYLDWNLSRDEVMADRARGRKRVERFRNRDHWSGAGNSVGNGVTNGVGNALRDAKSEGCNGVSNDGSTETTVPRSTDTTSPLFPTDQVPIVKAAAAPRLATRPVENPDDNVEVITALVLKDIFPLIGVTADDGDLVEATKGLCAKKQIAYDGQTVRKAVDSAKVRVQFRPAPGIFH